MTTRRLVLTWGLLMGLTVLTGIAGVGGGERLGALWLAVLAAVTIVKARLILARYLRLEAAPAFLGGFTTAVVAVVVLVALSFMVVTRPLMPARPAPHPAPTHARAARSGPGDDLGRTIETPAVIVQTTIAPAGASPRGSV